MEPYPTLKIEFKNRDFTAYEPVTVNRVQIYLRCDAMELYHRTNFEIRVNDGNPGDVYTSPRLTGGKICGTSSGLNNGGTSFTVPCAEPIANVTEIWIQKTSLHSHGSGWPNFNGNRWNSWTGNSPAQNSNAPLAFLMVNEVVVY